jgi:hypothetical protein
MFQDIEVVWKELREVYSGDFRNLIYVDLPAEAAVVQTLGEIKKRLETVEWSIKIPE